MPEPIVELTEREESILRSLSDAYGEFLQYNDRTKDETEEFGDAIRDLQRMITLRVVQRSDINIHWAG